MKQIISVILTLMLTVSVLSACGEGGSSGQEPVAETTAAIDLWEKAKVIFEESFQSHGFKGAGYVVYKGDEIYSGGTGKANKKENIDNSADAVYNIASLTKQFTAAAILRLCEEKKLSTEDTLAEFFPDYKAGADVTILQMLTMQSGIPDFVREYDENGNEVQSGAQITIDGITEDNSAQENHEAVRAWIFSQELLFSPGERFSYSNSNYFLLGEIIEQISGKSYFDYLKTSFFEPLEMTTAGFDENYDVSGVTVAKGYNNTGSTADLYGYPGVAFGSGDVMASPKDLYKWAAALHGGRVLTDEMYKLMTEKHADCGDGISYGCGLMIADSSVGAIFLHTGVAPCFFSYAIYSPQKELFLSVMSNYASESAFSVANDVSTKIMQEII